MGQAIGETVFDIWYLTTALLAGIGMLRQGKRAVVKMAGWMTVLLGGGDAFHLVPRMYALWTTGLEANAAALGAGKFITSVTMTMFYVLLYFIWREYYHQGSQPLATRTIFLLAAIRVVLCILPGNQWLSPSPPLAPGILRNLPFLMMGLIIMVLFYRSSRVRDDQIFRFMPLAIGLSFGFYIPVVLFSGSYPMIGMLMIPKTLAYVWIVLMCRTLHKTAE